MPGLTSQRSTPSSQLQSSILLILPTLSHAVSAFWQHPNLRALYPRYLVALHTVIRASVPLMQEAQRVALSEHLNEPFGRQLADYLGGHIPEEIGHDQWLLDDLRQLGYPPEVAFFQPPIPAVASLVGSQYYYIHHINPCAILGYMAVLEGYPPSEDLCVRGAQQTGFPKSAFRTLRKHANLDPYHRRDLYQLIDSIQLTETQHALVRTNALLTVDHINQLFAALNSEHLITRLSWEPH